MLNLFFINSLLAISLGNCDFQQVIEIDTNKRLLETTPDYNTDKALKAHQLMELGFSEYKFDIFHDYYLLFRYRDDALISIWLKILLENPENEILKIWFINALSQMNNKSNLQYAAIFKNSTNSIIRECAANAYGFLGTIDSIPAISAWLKKEQNCYVRKTLETSIKQIKKGGYQSQAPYLPKYYKEKPLKIEFIYNKAINDDPDYQIYNDDTSSIIIPSVFFIFPHQQYLWKLKGAPKAGYYNSKHGPIYHIGIDSGWLLEGLPIHSICDGIVKQTSHNLSWGNLVVIETQPKDSDTMCIVYGHLSPFLNVKPGDIVKKGDKIGQIGNSTSYDNGGYWAHLHMGIERKSFINAGIAGYDTDTSTYINPLQFINEHKEQRHE